MLKCHSSECRQDLISTGYCSCSPLKSSDTGNLTYFWFEILENRISIRGAVVSRTTLSHPPPLGRVKFQELKRKGKRQREERKQKKTPTNPNQNQSKTKVEKPPTPNPPTPNNKNRSMWS